MNRRQAAALILTAWLAALGWLVARESSRTTGGTTSRWPVPPGSSFQTLRLGSTQIGIATMTVDTLPEGVRVVELTTIDLPTIDSGVARRTTKRVESLYSRRLTLLAWQTDLLTEHGRERSGGTVSGDTLATAIQSAGAQPETLQVRLPGPVVLPGAVTLAAAAQGIPRRGMLYAFRLLDPIELVVRSVRYTAVQESLFTVVDSAEFDPDTRRWVAAHADTIRAWRLNGTESGLPVSRWTDAAGQPVRVEYPIGATTDRAAFELVNTNFRALPAPVWDSGATMPSYRFEGQTARPEVYCWVALSLMPPAPLPTLIPALDGGSQRRSADTLYPSIPADTTPPAMAPGPGSPLVEADSQVQALAAWYASLSPGARVGSLEARLRRTIGLREGPGVSPAGLVLHRRTGTEAERALVAVAVARAARVPARRVWGVVWQAGAWRVRPWAEIWNDGWIPVDVGAGTRPGDRVRLGIGADARFLDLAIRAGRLRFEFGKGQR
jgi:hypothetical protein